MERILILDNCKYSYNEIIKRDKASLDIFWLKDYSLTDLDNLMEPEELAEEITENLMSAVDRFNKVMKELK